MKPSIQEMIVRECEVDLVQYGDTFEGMGWRKKNDYAQRRYRVMLDVIRSGEEASILDFGCGASHLYDYIRSHRLSHITYSGLDMSDSYLDVARRKFPDIVYYQADILDPTTVLPTFDYIIMNGVFTFKGTTPQHLMLDYFHSVLKRAATFAKKGIAFNVMSKHLDWERDDLFHLALSDLATFLDNNIGRNFLIRHEYELFEYTTYVYLTPWRD